MQQLEWKKLYKNNLDSLFKFTFAEQEKTYYLIQAYEKLYLFYDKLEYQANEEYKLRLEADKKTQEAINIADRENKRKKKWRKIAIYEGIALTGSITAIYIFIIK